MNYALRFESRNRVRTISIPVNWTLAEVEGGAQRLRSWAMISGVGVAGSPFATLDSPMSGTVHLPIASESMPHPQTGIRLDAVNASPYVAAESVRFSESRAVIRALRDAYETHGVRAELHACGSDFMSGEVRLPILRLPAVQDAFIALPGAEPAAAAPQATAAASVLAAPSTPVSVITIAHQPASGGERIARAVGRRLGFNVADRQVVERAAKLAGVDVKTIEAASYHRSFLGRLIDGMAAVSPHNDPLSSIGSLRESHGIYTHREYRQFVESAISDTAENGNAVILGHGAQFALQDRADTFRVLITASEESRVAELIADGATTDEARKSIRRQDAERKGFFKDAEGADWLDPGHYDLVISADNYDAEMAADIICHAANLRTRQAARSVASDTPGARRRIPARLVPPAAKNSPQTAV